jgi:hypothetical protein
MPTPLEQLHERLAPIMKEHLDGFVLVGYMTNSEGKRERVAIADGGGDAAIADGLRPFMMNASMWAAMSKPTTPDPSTPS